MPSQAMHIEFRAGVSRGLLMHYRGDTRYILSVPREGLDAVVELMDRLPAQWQGRQHGAGAAHALLEQVREQFKGRRGRPVKNPYMDLVIGGPPPYESLGSEPAWTQARTLDYFRNVLTVLSAAVPDAVVVSAHIHQDERAPHMHLSFLPLNAKTGRVGWAQVRTALSGLPATRTVVENGEEVEKRVSNREHLRGFHTRLHEQVTRHYGLDRDLGRKGEYEPRFDRDVGVFLRAACGGYSDAYMANASEGLRERLLWSAAEGRRLRAEIRELPEGIKVDPDWEFIQCFKARWDSEPATGRHGPSEIYVVRQLSFRHRLPGTTTLREERVAAREGEVAIALAEVDQARYQAETEEWGMQAWERELVATIDALDRREDALAARERLVEQRIALLDNEIPRLREQSRGLLTEVVSAVRHLAGSLHGLHRPLLAPLRKALNAYLAADDTLAGLRETLRDDQALREGEDRDQPRYDSGFRDW